MERFNPKGVMSVFLWLETDTTLWGFLMVRNPFPGVAAKRGNPGLGYITASRYYFFAKGEFLIGNFVTPIERRRQFVQNRHELRH